MRAAPGLLDSSIGRDRSEHLARLVLGLGRRFLDVEQDVDRGQVIALIVDQAELVGVDDRHGGDGWRQLAGETRGQAQARGQIRDDLTQVERDLAAERVGDEVRLHWTTPEKTTDRIAIKGPMTADICRIGNPPSPVCTPMKQLPVQSGLTQAVDVLPSSFTADPPTLLAYRVEILNSSGHSAGPSPEAFAAAGAAPPPVEHLQATPTPDGAMLEQLAGKVDTSHIMLGSDFPFGEVKPVEFVQSATKIPEALRQAILGANAARFLGVDI